MAILAAIVILWRVFGPGLPGHSTAPDFDSAESYQLTYVVDGDTIRVKGPNQAVTVRLVGIDCPERDQPYGAEAAALVRQLTQDKNLRLRGTQEDRYDRRLAHVDADGVWVNRELVVQGAAWAYRGQRDPFSDDLEDAEAEARSARRGLWAQPEPVHPADWRNR